MPISGAQVCSAWFCQYAGDINFTRKAIFKGWLKADCRSNLKPRVQSTALHCPPASARTSLLITAVIITRPGRSRCMLTAIIYASSACNVLTFIWLSLHEY